MMTSIDSNHEPSEANSEGVSGGGDTSGGGGGVIEVDMPCWGCNYNLRSIHSDKTCPECGTPVARALQGDRLIFSHPNLLRRIVTGMNWMLISVVISLILSVLWFVRPLIVIDIEAYIAILELAYFINWIILLTGVFFVTSSEVGRGSKQSILRPLARWFMLAAGIFSTVLGVAYFALSFVSNAIAIPLYSLSGLIHTMGSVALLLYLGSLAGRAGKPGLVLQSRILPVGYAIGLFFALLVNFFHLLLTLDIISNQSMSFEVLGYANLVRVVLNAVITIWELIFFILFRRAIVAILKLVKTNTKHYPRNQTPANYIRNT